MVKRDQCGDESIWSAFTDGFDRTRQLPRWLSLLIVPICLPLSTGRRTRIVLGRAGSRGYSWCLCWGCTPAVPAFVTPRVAPVADAPRVAGSVHMPRSRFRVCVHSGWPGCSWRCWHIIIYRPHPRSSSRIGSFLENIIMLLHLMLNPCVRPHLPRCPMGGLRHRRHDDRSSLRSQRHRSSRSGVGRHPVSLRDGVRVPLERGPCVVSRRVWASGPPSRSTVSSGRTSSDSPAGPGGYGRRHELPVRRGPS